MSAAGAVGNVSGFAFKGLGDESKTKAQEDAANFNASRAHEQSVYASEAGQENLNAMQIQATKQLGSIRAAYGANGISVASGSPQRAVEGAAAIQRMNENALINKTAFTVGEFTREEKAYDLQEQNAADAGSMQIISDFAGMATGQASTYGGGDGGGGTTLNTGGGGGGGGNYSLGFAE